jgi:NAD(P)-dependent dehydrogenase (short-subunit alcohol dehydrogenase family)
MRSGFDLSGERILITGAAGGIGEATARVCAALGAELVLVDRRPTEPLAQSLRGGNAKSAAFV